MLGNFEGVGGRDIHLSLEKLALFCFWINHFVHSKQVNACYVA